MMGAALYLLLQCTWGLLQTAVGAAVLLRYRKRPRFRFRGAVVTSWPRSDSISLGMFIFLTDKPPRDRRGVVPLEEIPRRLLVHEYGHTIQSLILGPLYLPLIGLPSALWAQLPPCRRIWYGNTSYFSFFTEKTANSLGELAAKELSMEDILI